MKRFIMNMTLAVAALAMAAGTVSAQTLKAEIPFAFRVGKQLMQPGEYRLSVDSNQSPLLALASPDTKKTIFVLTSGRTSPSKDWTDAGTAKLRFACVENSCSLTRMWSGDGDAYNFHTTRGKDGEMRVAEITLTPTRAE